MQALSLMIWRTQIRVSPYLYISPLFQSKDVLPFFLDKILTMFYGYKIVQYLQPVFLCLFLAF